MSAISEVVKSGFVEELQLRVARYSLVWLAVANFVGVWLSVLLLKPEWGEWLGEWSYGRWASLHLNWQLYGWCSLPAVGALFRRILPPTKIALRHAEHVLWLWSIALLAGGWSWLQGSTTGKLFLDWNGVPMVVFILVLGVLWAVLATYHVRSFVSHRAHHRTEWAGDSVTLLVLSIVPPVLFWSSRRDEYPPIDPSTGGPTGASLLGSTLVVVLLCLLLPKALRIPQKVAKRSDNYWWCLGACVGVFAMIRGGSHLHSAWPQVMGLGCLLIWGPLLAIYLRNFQWERRSVAWYYATVVWWNGLLLSGVLSFLPGALDAVKFTHVLVAHAHLAMAGFLASLNMLILCNISTSANRVHEVLTSAIGLWCWNAALFLHLAALAVIAVEEIRNPAGFFSGSMKVLYLLRSIPGVMMALTSAWWAVRIFCISDSPRPVAAGL